MVLLNSQVKTESFGRSGEEEKFDSFFFGGGLEVEIIPHIVLFSEYTHANDKRGIDLGPSIREENLITNLRINFRQLHTIKGGLKAYF